MAGVLGGKMFSFKNVTQMRPAGGAEDLRASAVGIGLPPYRARHGVVEARPAAPRIEFVLGMVQRRAAASAEIGTGFRQVPVRSGKRRLGAFGDNDMSFRFSKMLHIISCNQIFVGFHEAQEE